MKIVQNAKDDVSCNTYRPQKEFTHVQEFIDNLPYILMTLIGAAINYFFFENSLWGVIAAGLYVCYSIAGAFWIILFVCPYCHFYGTRACPCGYGQIATKLRPKSSENRFAEKFKKHIPVIVPLWLVPVIEGAIFLISDFNQLMLYLVIAFVIDAFIILPLVSKIYGCGHCQQKNDCPWMANKTEQSVLQGCKSLIF